MSERSCPVCGHAGHPGRPCAETVWTCVGCGRVAAPGYAPDGPAAFAPDGTPYCDECADDINGLLVRIADRLGVWGGTTGRERPWRSEDDARQAWELVEPIIAGGPGEHAGTLVVDGRLLAGFATRVEQRQAANDRLREALQRIERVVADKVNAGQLLDAADALEVLTFARRALAVVSPDQPGEHTP